MDIIKFQIEERMWPNGESFEAVKICINQQDLFSMIGMGWAQCGLPPDVIYLPSRHLLDEPDSWWFDEETKKVFITRDSQNGMPEIDSVIVRIACDNRTVVWSDFQLQHPEDFPFLSANLKSPIFKFDQTQYEAALHG